MDLSIYQKEALRTFSDLGTKEKNITHCMFGISTEFGELLDIFKKNLAYGKELDKIHITEEYADIWWYFAILCTLKKTPLKGYTPSHNFTDEEKADPVFRGIILIRFHAVMNEIIQTNTIEKLEEYLYSLADLLNIDFNKSLDKNIRKLKKRYPEKFTEENALKRDLEEERKELEK